MRGVNCKLQVVSTSVAVHTPCGINREANFIFPMYTRPVAMVVEYILARNGIKPYKEKLYQHYVV